MDHALDAIKRVVDAFERSNWSEIDVRWGAVRVHLSVGAAPPTFSSTAVPAPKPDEEPEPAPASSPAPPPGAHLVVAPSPGIFWRSPEPGAPPFAAVGDHVTASTTVCIIEVMKLMNHLKAGIDGEVVAVFGENGAPVRKGDPIFAISPSGTS